MRRTIVALVLVLHGLGVPVVALGVLGLAVVALVLVRRLGVMLRRLRMAVVTLVLVRRLRVVLGLACTQMLDCQQSSFCARSSKVQASYMHMVSDANCLMTADARGMALSYSREHYAGYNAP